MGTKKTATEAPAPAEAEEVEAAEEELGETVTVKVFRHRKTGDEIKVSEAAPKLTVLAVQFRKRANQARKAGKKGEATAIPAWVGEVESYDLAYTYPAPKAEARAACEDLDVGKLPELGRSDEGK